MSISGQTRIAIVPQTTEIDRREPQLLRCRRSGAITMIDSENRPVDRDEATHVSVGQISIDPATGEVVGWSADYAANQIEYLTRICADAQAAIKAQQAVHDAARAALKRLLVESGQQSVRTQFGTPSLRTQTRREGRPDRVAEAVRRHELSRDQERLIWMCARSLDVKGLDELAAASLLPVDVIDDLVETKQTTFVQVSAARR